MEKTAKWYDRIEAILTVALLLVALVVLSYQVFQRFDFKLYMSF